MARTRRDSEIEQQAAHAYDSPMANHGPRVMTFFVPGEGIEREVITTDLYKYLGNDATVRPGENLNQKTGSLVQGFVVTAYRPLTTAQLLDLRHDSSQWREQRRGVANLSTKAYPAASIGYDRSADRRTDMEAISYRQPPARLRAPSPDDEDMYDAPPPIARSGDPATTATQHAPSTTQNPHFPRTRYSPPNRYSADRESEIVVNPPHEPDIRRNPAVMSGPYPTPISASASYSPGPKHYPPQTVQGHANSISRTSAHEQVAYSTLENQPSYPEMYHYSNNAGNVATYTAFAQDQARENVAAPPVMFMNRQPVSRQSAQDITMSGYDSGGGYYNEALPVTQAYAAPPSRTTGSSRTEAPRAVGARREERIRDRDRDRDRKHGENSRRQR